jgi:hypothetical protein
MHAQLHHRRKIMQIVCLNSLPPQLQLDERYCNSAESNFMPRVLRMINKALQKLFVRFSSEQNNIPATAAYAAYFAAEPL